jgi:hypothetical protein
MEVVRNSSLTYVPKDNYGYGGIVPVSATHSKATTCASLFPNLLVLFGLGDVESSGTLKINS